MQASTDHLKNTENKKTNPVLTVILAVLLIGAIATCAILFLQQKTPATGENGMSTPEDDAKVIAEVSKIMILPEETPSMATVLDVTKLSDQPFFKNAQNGDKLMLFTAAQKAILYRPSTNQIVETMPLIMDQNQQSSDSTLLQ